VSIFIVIALMFLITLLRSYYNRAMIKNRKKAIESYKTRCCNAAWKVVGRADFRCVECDKDVTMEIVFLSEALDE
jgi:tRNA(Ile2) C34 agmatinyltransferase TiaS